jgi:uncharacterized protein DUF6677
MSETAETEAPVARGGPWIWGVAAFVAGWLVPGLGHALQRRWTRAAVFLVSITALAAVGVELRGAIFGSDPTGPFEWLGFLADAGSGVLYFAARSADIVADVSHAAGDYGTRFFAAAGALNLLCAFDAYAIATGRKS